MASQTMFPGIVPWVLLISGQVMMWVVIEDGFYLRAGTINLMRALGGVEHTSQLEHVYLLMGTRCLSGRCRYYFRADTIFIQSLQ